MAEGGISRCREPLLVVPARLDGGTETAARWASLAIVASVTLLTYWPTLSNGFLTLAFDDQILLDTPALRALGTANLWAMATEFVHAHYVPLTLLSLAVDYRLWGLDPWGTHLTNVLLQATAASLACAFLWGIMPSVRSATFAALVFAVHPVQLEAVTLAIQRKTLLSGALFFLTLILYRRWCAVPRPATYAFAVLAFAAAALAKPIVVTLPPLLLLHDYVFVGGRLRLLDKLPFVAIATAVGLAAMAAHAEVGATHGPHGGTLLSHVLMMGRVGLEYAAAALLPANLSPIYYYPRTMAFAPLNFAAVAAIALAAVFVAIRRRRYPWTFFCLAWFALTLLPESNVVPLAQLRADRFLYLPILAAGIWLAIGLERLPPMAVGSRHLRLPGIAVGAVVIAMLALTTRAAAPIWRSDVTAWQRVVERHPWSARARKMLGDAHADRHDLRAAEREYLGALEIDEGFAEAHLVLARLYLRHGMREAAEARLRRAEEITPDEPGLAALRAEMAR